MEETPLAIQEDSVGLPDLGQELPVECQLGDAASVEPKPRVKPGLSEVAIQAEHLPSLIYWPDGPDRHVQLHLSRFPSTVGPHLLVVPLLDQQVVQGVRHL